MSSAKDIGIDFGTTNSSATRFDSVRGMDKDRFYLFGDDKEPIPSVVAIDDVTGEVHTGRDAWERRSVLEGSCVCISSIKGLLGDVAWKRTIAGRPWTVVEIASRVFDTLGEAALSKGEKISSATVAIPIGLDSNARRMLRNAAQMSGITVEEFVSESTAAFFANYAELKGDGTVAVFDWGGGTLDVSVLEHRRGSVRELATSGMPVAGDALDETLARRIHAMISRERGLDVAFDDMDAVDKDQILVRSEELKRSFSKEDSVRLLLMRYGDVVAYTKYLSYEWFEEVLSPIVEDAMRCLENAIRQAGSTPAGIDRVLLVGGSSNLRPLQEKMRERYGDRLYMSGDPLWCVSKGSAVLSHLHGAYVSAQDVSVVLADGTHYALLHEGERVDGWHKVFDFGVTDTSETVRVVFAGSRDIEGDDSRFRTIDVPGYGFLEERLRLEAEVDKNHVFRVRMKSTMRPDRDSEVWEYDKLKLSYDISGWN